MKVLKFVLFLLLMLFIGLAIYIAIQPNNYQVTRTRNIKAPVEQVYNNVIDFKNWETWSSWIEKNPNTKLTYPEQTKGIGGSYSWQDDDGIGTMKTISALQNQTISQEMQFDDFEPSKVNWTFTPKKDGTTDVTWSMKGDNIPFGFKAYALTQGGFDKMIGPDFKRGLEKLDSLMVIEAQKMTVQKKYKLGKIMTHELETQKFIGFHHIAKMEDLPKLFAEFMPKAGMYAMKNLKPNEFIPAAVYKSWDEEKGETELYIGLLLKKNLTPAQGMTTIDLPAGKTIMMSKFGTYGEGDFEAHTAIDAYIKANNLTQKMPIWELYVNDPTQVKPIEIQTDIYYPVE